MIFDRQIAQLRLRAVSFSSRVCVCLISPNKLKKRLDGLGKGHGISDLCDQLIDYEFYANSVEKQTWSKAQLLRFLLSRGIKEDKDRQIRSLFGSGSPLYQKSPLSRNKIHKKENKSSGIKKILYLCEASAINQDGSALYRCVFPLEGLKGEGVQGKVISCRRPVITLLKALLESDLVVCGRLQQREKVVFLLEMAKRIGLPVVADFDDPLFHSMLDSTGTYLSGKASKEELVESFEQVQSLFPYYQGFLCSTPKIAEELKKEGKPLFVLPNRIDHKSVIPTPVKRKGALRLIYPSGTATHGHDYALYEKEIAKVLRRYPKVRLTFLGRVTVNKNLFSSEQVELCRRVPFKKMIHFFAAHDLCLVPLAQTPFNDCKSAVKFIESGAAGMTCLATKVREFDRVISKNKAAYLVSSPEEFYEKLMFLCEQPEQVRKMGRHAWEEVKENYTTQDQEIYAALKNFLESI